jgi:hypothetical protein
MLRKHAAGVPEHGFALRLDCFATDNAVYDHLSCFTLVVCTEKPDSDVLVMNSAEDCTRLPDHVC